IAGVTIDVDGHREQCAIFAPRHLGYVAERELGAGVEISDDHVRGTTPLRGIAPQRHVSAVVAQREALDVFERGLRASAEIDRTNFVPRRRGSGPTRLGAPSAAAATGAARATASTTSVGDDGEKEPVAVVGELRGVRRMDDVL